MRSGSKGGFPFLLFILSASPLFGGDYAADFLTLGAGARALGMGGAFSSISDDGSAPCWNPAGLANVRSPELTLMHASTFSGLASYNYFSYAQPLPGDLTVAISYIRLSVDSIPIFGETPGTPSTGYFGDIENCFLFSLGRLTLLPSQLPAQVSLGGNLKVLYQALHNYRGTGVGSDLSLKLRFGIDRLPNSSFLGNLSLGVNLQDLLSTPLSWNTPSRHEDRIPPNLKAGLSYSQPLPLSSHVTLAFDRDTRYGGQNHLGIEYGFKSLFALRLGWEDGNLTAGAGFRIWRLTFDYAFCGYELGSTHRVSGGVSFPELGLN